MTALRFGIVGTGYIAGVLARTISEADGAIVTAVASRRLESARSFVEDYSGVAAVEGWLALLARKDVDAVYVATPTAHKHEIAMAAIEAGRHVLVDKPFVDAGSVRAMLDAAQARNLLFMDATHFPHHPRTASLRARSAELVGRPLSLQLCFVMPLDDQSNIRFDPSQEPMGLVGDMGWYPMRAMVEYLRPDGVPSIVAAAVERNAETGAMVRANGFFAFPRGEVTSFEFAYRPDTYIMDLQLLGTDGIVTMDDFVLDWGNSLLGMPSDRNAGWTRRPAGGGPNRAQWTEIPTDKPQQVRMIEAFVRLCGDPTSPEARAFGDATIATQNLVDLFWAKVR